MSSIIRFRKGVICGSSRLAPVARALNGRPDQHGLQSTKAQIDLTGLSARPNETPFALRRTRARRPRREDFRQRKRAARSPRSGLVHYLGQEALLSATIFEPLNAIARHVAKKVRFGLAPQ